MRSNKGIYFGAAAAAGALCLVLGTLAGPMVSAAPAEPPPATSPAHPSGPQADRTRLIAGFLSKHCYSCHGPEKKKGDLVLHTLNDVQSLTESRKTVQQAIKMVRAGEMPPESRPRPAVVEVDAFADAVDSFYTEVDKTAPLNPGRVTVRRLNRNEYNNTIRDLLGVDARPADDFPADDIGHGFDNIGDVLTVSPVLMERYLAAAENVANSAILLTPPAMLKKEEYAKFMEPAGPNVPEDLWRPIPKDDVSVKWRIGEDGDYVLKVRVNARSPDKENVRVAIMLDDKELSSHEVIPTDRKSDKGQIVEQKLHLDVGEYRFKIRIANPSPNAVPIDVSEKAKKDGKKPVAPDDVRVLLVRNMILEGPADTRPLSQRKFFAPADANAPHAEQTRQVLTRFLTRAYRRPATQDEINHLAKLVADQESAGQTWEGAMRMAVTAVLVSPKFLFRLELDDRPQSPEVRPLDDYALASRLSYFLWSSMPDDELFELAAKKQLSTNLEPQVRRMLADPRSKSLVDNFAMQWLQLNRLRTFQPDTKQFPNFDEDLRTAMLEETTLFLNAIFTEDHSVLDLLDADFTFLNEPLARHYGIVDTKGNTRDSKDVKGKDRGDRIPYRRFVRVSPPKGSLRGGLLTQASVLAVTSNPTRTSPVKRGKWVLEQILGASPPPPPPNVPELKEDGKSASTASLRQRMEMHRENPACANCHAKMDPIGFAFENFDAVGGFRTKDGSFSIDAAGELPDGTKFNGAAELRTMLVAKRKDAFVRSLSEKLLIYALGRGTEYYDDRAITSIARGVETGDYKFSRLVTEIVKSDPFLKRRGLNDQNEPKAALPADSVLAGGQ